MWIAVPKLFCLMGWKTNRYGARWEYGPVVFTSVSTNLTWLLTPVLKISVVPLNYEHIAVDLKLHRYHTCHRRNKFCLPSFRSCVWDKHLFSINRHSHSLYLRTCYLAASITRLHYCRIHIVVIFRRLAVAFMHSLLDRTVFFSLFDVHLWLWFLSLYAASGFYLRTWLLDTFQSIHAVWELVTCYLSRRVFIGPFLACKIRIYLFSQAGMYKFFWFAFHLAT